MSAHTPKPWTCEPPACSGHVHVIRSPNGRSIAHVGSDLPDDARQAANAALVVSAPDLLDALRALTAFAATFTRSGATRAEGKLYDEADLAPNGPAIARAVAAGRAAIARAEGRAP